MKVFSSINSPEVASILMSGGVGIVRTDTIYGLIAVAQNESAVQRVYELKGRDDTKSPIVLVDSIDQLFDVPTTVERDILSSVWPGKVSVIVTSTAAPIWIRRDNGSVAYRLPNVDELRSLVRQTGPLIAPSANPQGQPPAMTIEQAGRYFGDGVDFYIDGGEVNDEKPSTLIRVQGDGTVSQLR